MQECNSRLFIICGLDCNCIVFACRRSQDVDVVTASYELYTPSVHPAYLNYESEFADRLSTAWVSHYARGSLHQLADSSVCEVSRWIVLVPQPPLSGWGKVSTNWPSPYWYGGNCIWLSAGAVFTNLCCTVAFTVSKCWETLKMHAGMDNSVAWHTGFTAVHASTKHVISTPVTTIYSSPN